MRARERERISAESERSQRARNYHASASLSLPLIRSLPRRCCCSLLLLAAAVVVVLFVHSLDLPSSPPLLSSPLLSRVCAPPVGRWSERVQRQPWETLAHRPSADTAPRCSSPAAPPRRPCRPHRPHKLQHLLRCLQRARRHTRAPSGRHSSRASARSFSGAAPCSHHTRPATRPPPQQQQQPPPGPRPLVLALLRML